MESTKVNLKNETENFFHKHWNNQEMGYNPPPEWKENPPIKQGSIENYDKGGCYALLENETVIYIGLGAKRGSSNLKEHGISVRLLSHVIKPTGDGGYETTDKWKSITEILTIGFPAENTYLAASLEDYLIGKLNPSQNSNKKV